MNIPLVILICAPIWALTLVMVAAALSIIANSYRGWGMRNRVVVPLAVGVPVLVESVLLGLVFLA